MQGQVCGVGDMQACRMDFSLRIKPISAVNVMWLVHIPYASSWLSEMSKLANERAVLVDILGTYGSLAHPMCATFTHSEKGPCSWLACGVSVPCDNLTQMSWENVACIILTNALSYTCHMHDNRTFFSYLKFTAVESEIFFTLIFYLFFYFLQ